MILGVKYLMYTAMVNLEGCVRCKNELAWKWPELWCRSYNLGVWVSWVVWVMLSDGNSLALFTTSVETNSHIKSNCPVSCMQSDFLCILCMMKLLLFLQCNSSSTNQFSIFTTIILNFDEIAFTKFKFSGMIVLGELVAVYATFAQ